MRVEHHEGTAAELHALAMPEGDAGPALWVLRPTAPALVMGSAQREADFDVDSLQTDGVALAPRRSGGGAVFIEPAGVVWVDVLAPRGSAYWSDDLGETFLRVGERWQAALAEVGVASEIVRASPDRSAEARLACWAGLGWGEVTVDGAKIVGLSMRRTRWGARIQGMGVIDASADRAPIWLHGLDNEQRQQLRDRIGHVGLEVERDELERAVLAELSRP
jgi:lipoate-protein ligase A